MLQIQCYHQKFNLCLAHKLRVPRTYLQAIIIWAPHRGSTPAEELQLAQADIMRQLL